MKNNFVRIFILALVIPAAAEAQQSVEVGPLFGFYAPVGTYHHEADYFRVGTPEHPDENRGTAWGVEARFWKNRKLGLQVQAVTSSADHPTLNSPAGPIEGSSTQVTSVTAQAVYVLSPASSASRFWLSAGGGVIRHSGAGYVPYGSPTNPAGALGLGAAIALPHGLSANLGIASLLYHWELSDSRGLYQRGFETDVLMHAGLTLNLR